MRELEIRDVEFDSGLLAGKVGEVLVTDSARIGRDFEAIVERRARDAEYDLLYLKTNRPMLFRRFRPVGVLHHYETSAAVVVARLAVAAGRCPVREVSEQDWIGIEKLLDHGIPTRFSLDAHLQPDLVRCHKIALLRHYWRRHPRYSLVATDRQGNVIGFQFTYPGVAEFDLYEISVVPELRRTGVAVCLLAENMHRLLRDYPDVSRVTTRIYHHNEVSRKFFGRLGFVSTGEPEHWYHAWIDTQARGANERDDQEVPVHHIADRLHRECR